ncbi:MAG TPA: RNA polymerase sigma factor [Candidatus Angelobacter sp.]|jgi:RNA polymerase sigma-70 factor (ECF subfamily)|nr:RNA polymerase sigma factor [Candidatus Angelobacter sp.]
MTDTPLYRPGSDEDFNRLYRDSHARILRTLVAVLGDVGAAEDCVQDAFIKAYKAWPRWQPDAPAEAWLHRIAIRVAISHRRREKLRETGSLILHLGRGGADPAEELAAHDLLAALRRLPPDQAAAVVLRHHHGYSNREIAAALGAPESTVAARLAAAKRKLRDDLGVAMPLAELDATPISGASR